MAISDEKPIASPQPLNTAHDRFTNRPRLGESSENTATGLECYRRRFGLSFRLEHAGISTTSSPLPEDGNPGPKASTPMSSDCEWEI